jgi:DNA-binding IscR family transcriptional regulator
MSAKAEYAVRAMIQLATVGENVLVKTDDLAKAQGIPPQFLVDILSDLRGDRLVRRRVALHRRSVGQRARHRAW